MEGGCSRVSNPLLTRQLGRACQATTKDVEIEKRVSMHTLRRSFATYLLEAKVDIRVIQTLLEHIKLETTALYAQMATNDCMRSSVRLMP
jgi:integrase/recombinase XerD